MKTLRFLIFFFIPVLLVGQAEKEVSIWEGWETDTTRREISSDELSVLLPRDRIPPVDSAVYIETELAVDSFFSKEPVIVVSINKETRAYPLSILIYHEIVNTEIGGVPVAITYCPLCNTSYVFRREIIFRGDKDTLSFGTSGMLRKSNLVMWDRETESLWQQLTGRCIAGKFSKVELEKVPYMKLSFEDFRTKFSEGVILSTSLGYTRTRTMYGVNPYVDYDNIDNERPRLYMGKIDSTFPSMGRTVDVKSGDLRKVYSFSEIQKKGVINDISSEKPVLIFHKYGTISVLDKRRIKDSEDIGSAVVFNPEVNGEILTFRKENGKFIDNQTGSKWDITGKCYEGELKGKTLKLRNHGHHFSFAFFAFYPESDVYGGD